MPIYLGDNNITGGFTTAEKNQFNNSINELKTGLSSISVPTQVSQLTNDSGYLSTEDITSIINSTIIINITVITAIVKVLITTS